MAPILPQGENIRRAVKWISEERQGDPARSIAKLIEEASVRFNLSPADGEFLHKFFQEQKA
ncbi:MAG: hypothetical protein WHT06_08245 [Desulfobacterales bacterium]